MAGEHYFERGFEFREFRSNGGGRTRTCGLEVMSLTSYQLLYPAMCTRHFIRYTQPVKTGCVRHKNEHIKSRFSAVSIRQPCQQHCRVMSRHPAADDKSFCPDRVFPAIQGFAIHGSATFGTSSNSCRQGDVSGACGVLSR